MPKKCPIAAGTQSGDAGRELEAARLFLTADGEKDKAWGNETIRWNPGEGWLEIRLQPHPRRKTATATRTRPPDQAAQDRPGPPASQDYLLLVQQERYGRIHG